MPGWVQDVAALLLVWMSIQIVWSALINGPSRLERRMWRALVRITRWLRRTPPALPLPEHRPIEDIADDVRRLRRTFHLGGMRFAKYEGCRLAYDGALGEMATSLGLAHLLALLPPGTELDLERERIEQRLEELGLVPPLWAT